MKATLAGAGLLAATVAVVAFSPSLPSNATANPPVALPAVTQALGQAKVEVVFVLDTTGSMSGLIDSAKEKIWSIATTMAQANPAPEISIGLVGYRDRGD